MIEINFRYRKQMFILAGIIFIFFLWYQTWVFTLIDINALHLIGALLLLCSITFFIWLPYLIAEFFR